jgi:cytochrome oxidase Cu insertion factor (SCO1/SenC/PrrC family)
MLRVLLVCFAMISLLGCANYQYPSQVKIGQPLLEFEGESLDGKAYALPNAVAGQTTLFLFGYVHKSQFDIDRWLIGLNQTNTLVPVFEIPAIQGLIPRFFSRRFDDAMREGIPREIWRDVITVYKDGYRVQKYTGNQSPKNARVLLIDRQGKVIHFYDRGFSVAALNALRAKL